MCFARSNAYYTQACLTSEFGFVVRSTNVPLEEGISKSHFEALILPAT
jgi:hypothetical protein